MAVRPLLVVLLISGVVGFAPAPLPRSDRAPGGLGVKNLQGVWNMVRYERNGSSVGASGLKVRINNEKWAFFRIEAPNLATATYDLVIDASKKPTWLDLKRDNNKTLVLHGIAKLEADTLTLLFTTSTTPGNRPTEFNAKNPNAYLLVLKREKS